MTAATFSIYKAQVPALTESQRQELSLMLLRLKQESPAWKREMSRRMAAMDSGKKFALSSLMPRTTDAKTAWLSCPA